MTYQIVDNLREERGMIASPKDCLEAAAIIEELAAALEPFGLVAENDIGTDESDKDTYRPITRYNCSPPISVGDLRRAREALRKLKGE